APTFGGFFIPPVLTNVNDIPALPTQGQFDLGLSSPTHFQTFNVYVPYVVWEKRASLPPDYALNGVIVHNEGAFNPLDLERFLQGGQTSGLASLVGPDPSQTGGFLPVGQQLPYAVHFQNDPRASTYVNQVRVVTHLDANLDARSFRLGDIEVGDITVHVPDGRSLFQGDFDFTQSKGFILRVSAGIDLSTETATWLLQAIDPLTGQVLQDTTRGLLAPNNAQGQGAGFVGYTVEANDDSPSGAPVSAQAR